MPLNQINIRTEEIDEILGKTPNSIIRWGITVILFVILVLLVGSWFFKYPDKISSEIELTTLNPPAVVVAKSSGRIDSLFVSNRQPVKKGQYLAVIENPANFSDLLQAKKQADSLFAVSQDTATVLSIYNPSRNFSLGEVQNYFTSFISSFNNLVTFINLGLYSKKIEAIEKQISDYYLYYDYTYDQKKTLETDLKLAKNDFNRNKKLFESGTIPEAEMERAESRYLNKRYSFENIRTSLANINIQISQLKNQLIDLRLQQKQEIDQLTISLASAYKNLSAQFSIWEKRYLLKSPIEGKCVFTRFRYKNQNLNVGDQVMTIIPDEESNIIGRVMLPVAGVGKVKTGQKVNVKLDNYPYMEFGQLEGVVGKISSVPDEKNFYYVEVIFPNGMKTNYGKIITFTQKMHGTAEVITEDIRLFYRVLQPLRSLLNENT